MCACISAYRKVKNGNSVMGSPGMARLGIQYQSPIGYGNCVPLNILTIPCPVQRKRSNNVEFSMVPVGEPTRINPCQIMRMVPRLPRININNVEPSPPSQAAGLIPPGCVTSSTGAAAFSYGAGSIDSTCMDGYSSSSTSDGSTTAGSSDANFVRRIFRRKIDVITRICG